VLGVLVTSGTVLVHGPLNVHIRITSIGPWEPAVSCL
jgi:hypothetical protein